MKKRISLAVMSLAALIATMPSLAAAAAAQTPEAVADWFSADALSEVQGSERGVTTADDDPMPSFAAADAVSKPVEVRVFTREFIDDEESDIPFRSTDTWIASLNSDGKSLGVVSARFDEASNAVEMIGYGDENELGDALTALEPGSVVVHDEPHAAWFAIDGDEAWQFGYGVHRRQPMTVAELRKVVSQQYASDIAAAEGQDDSVGGSGFGLAAAEDTSSEVVKWALVFGLGLSGIAVVVLVRWNARRASPPGSGES